MPTHRRQFLQSALGFGGLAALGGHAAPAFLASAARAAEANPDPAGRKLVVIQLLGGNDGLNTVVPHRHDRYKEARRALRIPSDRVLKIDDELGLHPEMSGFARLLENNRLAVVQGVGYPNPDRSHFRSMEIWETARLGSETADLESGWLGRAVADAGAALDAGDDVPALHIGRAVRPLALRSPRVEVPALESLDQFRLKLAGSPDAKRALRAAVAEVSADTDAFPDRRTDANPLLAFSRRASLSAQRSSARLEAIDPDASPLAKSPHGLARRLGQIAQVIKAGFRTPIHYTTLEGFDTHANQFEAHAGLLREVSESVAGFHRELEDAGLADQVAVLVFSEFGRRVKENASLGTDHGAAAPLFVVGPVRTPGLVGEHPSLEPGDLDDGDLRHHTDFRRVYAAMLRDWLGIPAETVLGESFEPLPLFRA